MKTLIKILYIIFFIILILTLLKFFLVLLLVSLVLLWLRTLQMKKEPNQHDFSHGSVPSPKPDGFYQGHAGFDSRWVGKKFNAENSTGINVFKSKSKDEPASAQGSGVAKEKYPFVTSVGTGLFDEKLFVLKIDYNIKGNPFWIRWILDEIVQVAPNEYLGKMHIRLIPGFPFSVLYFELKK